MHAGQLGRPRLERQGQREASEQLQAGLDDLKLLEEVSPVPVQPLGEALVATGIGRVGMSMVDVLRRITVDRLEVSSASGLPPGAVDADASPPSVCSTSARAAATQLRRGIGGGAGNTRCADRHDPPPQETVSAGLRDDERRSGGRRRGHGGGLDTFRRWPGLRCASSPSLGGVRGGGCRADRSSEGHGVAGEGERAAAPGD